MSPALFGTLMLGGVAALDATPIAQSMLSQPLVTAAILGWMWGDMETALRIGVVLQLFAATTQPVGSRTPEDYAIGGVVGAGAGLALASTQDFSQARNAAALLGVFLGLASAMAGMPLIRWQRRFNEGLSHWCERQLQAGAEGALAESHRAAVVLAFAVGVGYTAICMSLGVWALGDVVRAESLRLAQAWSFAEPLWLGLGLATLLNGFVRRRLTRAALFGVALVGGWLFLMVGGPR